MALALPAGAAYARTYPGSNAAGAVASTIEFDRRGTTGVDLVVSDDDNYDIFAFPLTSNLAGTA